jgi:hypothetical protein
MEMSRDFMVTSCSGLRYPRRRAVQTLRLAKLSVQARPLLPGNEDVPNLVVARQLDGGDELLARRRGGRREDALDALAREMRREQLDEVIREAAQQRARAEANPGDVAREQVPRLDDARSFSSSGSMAMLATTPTPRPSRT